MTITDFFVNSCWIAAKNFDSARLSHFLDTSSHKEIELGNGFAIVDERFDEKHFISIVSGEWIVIIGKYYFLDVNILKRKMNELAKISDKAYCFGIDVWSDYYCFGKTQKNKLQKLIVLNDGEEYRPEFQVIPEDHYLASKESMDNIILRIADNFSVKFDDLERQRSNGTKILLHS